MSDLNSDSPQPNLGGSLSRHTWSAPFWALTVLAGAAAGLAGAALMQLLELVQHLSWGYDSSDQINLLEAATRAPAWRHLLILPAAGILVGFGGKLVRRLFGQGGELEGAIWFHSGRVAALPTLAKAVHTIVVVGMGVSLGREAPIKHAGGALASRLSQWCRLTRCEQRVLVACGVGAGMASAYNVPIGGALFAVEVLLGSISLRLVMPALVCSGVATVSSWVLLPTGSTYHVPHYPLTAQLTVWALLAGPLLGLAAVALVRAAGWAQAHKPNNGIGVFAAPIVVLAVFGAISIPFPQLLGNGKDAVGVAYLDGFSLSLLLALPALKLLAVWGCLSCGASGGLFTPTMTIGALLGGLLGYAWNCICPGAPMGSCAIIGSCAFLAAATQGPISSLLLVLELTWHIDATMAPMLLAVVGAVLAARQLESRSIYSVRFHSEKLNDKPMPSATLSPALDKLITRDFETVSASAGYGEIAQRLLLSPEHAPLHVVDHQGQLVGVIDTESVGSATLGGMPIDATTAADIVKEVQPLNSGMSEREVLERLGDAEHDCLPVIDDASGQLVGVVRRKERSPFSSNQS